MKTEAQYYHVKTKNFIVLCTSLVALMQAWVAASLDAGATYVALLWMVGVALFIGYRAGMYGGYSRTLLELIPGLEFGHEPLAENAFDGGDAA